jgi:hypothetical protein
MQQNLVSGTVTTEQLTQVLNAIKTIKDVLGPLLQNLDANGRQGLAKMGDKTLAFVSKAMEYSLGNPALNPNYLDTAEAFRDFDLVKKLTTIAQELAPLTRSVEDTAMLAGSDSYAASLMFYGSVKGAAGANVAGAAAVYADLKQRFPGRPASRVNTDDNQQK